MQGPWTRLHARWERSGAAIDDVAAATVLQEVDGHTSLLLMPGEDVPAPSGAWIPFRLRYGYPEGPVPEPAGAPYLLVVRVVATSDADRDEFRRWLDQEHAELQVSLPGVNWYLGYEQVGADHSFVNLWGVEDPAVPNSDAWARIRDTPWWARVAHVPANSDRGVYRTAKAPGG